MENKVINPKGVEILITMNEIAEIAKEAAREAVNEFCKEQEKQRQANSPEQAAKKMLSEYKKLKKVANAELQPTRDEALSLQWEYLTELMGNPDNKLYAEDKAYIVEKKMQYNKYKVGKIEKAVEFFKQDCESSKSESVERQYRIIKYLYFSNENYTVKDIAEKENMTDKTIYRDLGLAYRSIAMYLSAM